MEERDGERMRGVQPVLCPSGRLSFLGSFLAEGERISPGRVLVIFSTSPEKDPLPRRLF